MIRRAMLSLAAASLLTAMSGVAAGQGRVSDKDLENLIENLKEDSKKFADHFEDDLEKSTIRDTSEEKTAKRTAEKFVEQVDDMLDRFRDKKKLDRSLPVVYASYQRLEEYMGKISASRKTNEWWAKVRDEMAQIRAAANY